MPPLARRDAVMLEGEINKAVTGICGVMLLLSTSVDSIHGWYLTVCNRQPTMALRARAEQAAEYHYKFCKC